MDAMRWILILVFLTASVPAASADWRDARWGMTVDTLDELFGDEFRQRRREPITYGIPGRRILGVPFDITFTMDGRPATLQRVDLTSMELLEEMREGQFKALLQRLIEENGEPTFREVPDVVRKPNELWYVNRKVVWETDDTIVTLLHFFSAIFANSLDGSDILVLSYESAQPPVFADTDDDEGGWWPWRWFWK